MLLCKGAVETHGRSEVHLSQPRERDRSAYERLKEFQGGSPATREVLTLGQEMATSLGFCPSSTATAVAMTPPVAETAANEIEEARRAIRS
jgi:hypothetical protein